MAAPIAIGAPGKRTSGRPTPWLVPGVIAGSLVPFASVALRAGDHELGANPIAQALNQLGLTALILLVAALACTPLKTVFGWTWPIRIRKTLGLLGFFYASIHFLMYAGLDQALDARAILADIGKRPFVMVGFAALVLLVPLAITSTAKMLKRLGFVRWKRLHRLAYVATALGVVHFVWRVKKDVTEPAIYGAVLALFFAIRIGAWMKDRARIRAGG